MARDIGPFPPGQAVSPKFFVARSQEIKRILLAVSGATHGRSRSLFLTGKPGIGKSSLAVFVRAVAERKWKALGHHRS